MRVCAACGEANPERARFCLGCGAQLDLVAETRERRKTVTVVFADLSGSTAMGERLDPEAVRGVMSRYYEEMRAVLERHGGRVEKFIGDAVMAAFGVPVLHEDDALRAVRAALDMRSALAGLNVELEGRWGVRLQVRTGVNTGPIVAGDPAHGHAFIAGDAVNVAARLEQAASAGQILIGEPTFRLVRDAVIAHPVTPVSAKGKAEPLAAFELINADAEIAVPGRDVEWALVGRELQLAALGTAYDHALSTRRCQLTCVIGSAGAGKSRLTTEFVRSLGPRVSILTGRCLSYGDGITFWPLIELVRQAAAISPGDSRERALDKLAALLDTEEAAADVCQGVAGLLDLVDEAASQQEMFWAVRRLLESIAAQNPLVVVMDDLQWAEPALLDLIDYLAGFIVDRPMLLLCLARPELLDAHHDFAAETRVHLEPLEAEQCARLVGEVLASPVAAEVVGRVVDAAAGQPLFLVEYLRMLIDDETVIQVDGEWRFAGEVLSSPVPPSVEAVLGARLDRLTAVERDVIQAAAVIGQEFYAGAVSELVLPVVAHEISSHLEALVNKQLIHRGGTGFGGEDGLSFSHLLIRDVAYAGLLKETRAEMHERFAEWLERAAGQRVEEYEEILGYHLETAYRYRSELGPIGKRGRALADRARMRLTNAGRRALAREDALAAVNLLGRASELAERGTDAQLEVLLDLASALGDTGKLPQADAKFQEVLDLGEGDHNPLLHWRARVGRANLGFSLRADARIALADAKQAIDVFTKLDADDALASAWNTIGRHWIISGQFGQALGAYEQALVHAGRCGDRRGQSEAMTWILVCIWGGPTTVPQGIERCQQMLATHDLPRRVSAYALIERGPLLAMLGRLGQARSDYRRGVAILQELGLTVMAATVTQEESTVEMLAGDPEAAERCLRAGCAALETMGEQGILASSLSRLGEALYAQDRYVEAEAFARRGEQLSVDDDLDAQVRWRRVRAKCLAQRKVLLDAQRLAQEATELIGVTDMLSDRADALLDLAAVLSLAGHRSGERAAVADALELYEAKGNEVAARHARSILSVL